MFSDLLNQLDQRIDSLMFKGENRAWHCAVCGKTSNLKTDISRHVESVHIEDHPGLACDICGAVAKSREALRKHKSNVHKHTNKITY